MFVNADEIAHGLSSFQPETVSIQAGRLMLAYLAELSQIENAPTKLAGALYF